MPSQSEARMVHRKRADPRAAEVEALRWKFNEVPPLPAKGGWRMVERTIATVYRIDLPVNMDLPSVRIVTAPHYVEVTSAQVPSAEFLEEYETTVIVEDLSGSIVSSAVVSSGHTVQGVTEQDLDLALAWANLMGLI